MASDTSTAAAGEVTSFTCKNCGATTDAVAAGTGIRCPFCGSEYVIAKPQDPNAPQPEALIAFTVPEDQAQQVYRTWLGEGFFRPRDITSAATNHKMRAVYVPMWECRGSAESQWTAQAGYNRQEEETYTATENGQQVTKTRTKTETDWRPARGRHEATYERELVSGSKGLPQEWLSKLGDFDYGALRSFDPQYLLGREAEEPALDRTAARQAARQQIEDAERAACAKLVPGDTHKDLRVQTEISDLAERLLYLPVWMASFQYQGKPYRCVVNGQSGKIGGEAPVAGSRVALVLGAIAVVIAVIVLIAWLR